MKVFKFLLILTFFSQTHCAHWKKLSNATKGNVITVVGGVVSGLIGSQTAKDVSQKDKKEAIIGLWTLGGALATEKFISPYIYPQNQNFEDMKKQMDDIQTENKYLKVQMKLPQKIILKKDIMYDDKGKKRKGRMIRKKIDITVPSSIPNIYYRQTEKIEIVPTENSK